MMQGTLAPPVARLQHQKPMWIPPGDNRNTNANSRK
jgi:hypothetical protein